jgi:hypothetical protein
MVSVGDFAVDGVPRSYGDWLATLEPCPGCGHVDVMDNIEGAPMCAACSLEWDDDDDWDVD